MESKQKTHSSNSPEFQLHLNKGGVAPIFDLCAGISSCKNNICLEVRLPFTQESGLKPLVYLLFILPNVANEILKICPQISTTH